MAALLQALGEIGQESLAAEQIGQLDRLWRDAPRMSKERLDIAQCLAETLWDYDREDEALDRFSSALAEQRQSGGVVLPANNQGDLVSGVVEHLESRKQFARGEALLKKLIGQRANPREAARLSARLYQLYEKAIGQDGEVSLGRGGALYLAVEQKMQAELVSLDQSGLIMGLLSLYGTAHQKKEFLGVDDDLKRFAFQRLPKLFKRRSANYSQITTPFVLQTANTLHEVIGPHDAVAFLVERIETDPAWARRQAEDNMLYWINQLGQWRREAEYLGELSPRVLRILCEALRKDLQRHDANYPRLQPETFSSWPEKAAAFAATAEEVLAENKDSETVAVHVADFFNTALKQPARAADVLLDANRRHVLDPAAQRRLVKEFLVKQSRWADAVAVLQELVGPDADDDIEDCGELMRACCKGGQPESSVRDILKQADARWRQRGRWTEDVMAALGKACLDCGLNEQAAAYFQEAIVHRQRSGADHGSGDKKLSEYWGSLAEARVRMGKTVEAVDAAVAATASSPDRKDAAKPLQSVLLQVEDLDAFVAQLDRQAKKSGVDNPVVRKEAGGAYKHMGNMDKAIVQLRMAAELRPDDAETHQALLGCYGTRGDKEGAVQEVLRWRDAARGDIHFYENLANRFEATGKVAEAERARTSIVDRLPAEASSHQLLAGIRQSQDRWDEAIVQWEQVARIRPLAPTGLIGLAGALIQQERWDEARAAVKKLHRTKWPDRFSDASEQIGELDQKLNQHSQ